MREIKFRGQSWDGEWVYGDLFRDEGKCFIVDRFPVEANPETIGQYTGLKDKKGKEIYEGDIVLCGLYRYYVAFEEGCFMLKRIKALTDRLLGYMACGCEVIGNIYENPELLEETKELKS